MAFGKKSHLLSFFALLPLLPLGQRLAAPEKVADGRQADDDGADRAVHEGVAKMRSDDGKQRGGKADADVEQPEIRGRRDAGTRSRRPLHCKRLKRRRQRAKADAEHRSRAQKAHDALDLTEHQHADGEKDKAGINGIIRPLDIKETADNRARQDDDEREDHEEQARLGLQAKAFGIKRDKRQNAAVGKEHEAAEQGRRQRARLDKIGDVKALFRARHGLDDVVRQAFGVGSPEGQHSEARDEEEKSAAAEIADEQQTDHGADDHGEICRHGKVADALALARGRQNQGRHGRSGGRCHRKDAAVQQAQAVNGLQGVQPVEGEHHEEKGDGREEHQALFVDGVDELAGKRTADDRTNLERGHGHAGLPIAAAQSVHDENRQGRDHDVLRHEEKQVAPAHAEEFSGPKFFSLH